MNKIKYILLFILSSLLFHPLSIDAAERVKVVVTTTHLGEMLKVIGKNTVELTTLIPGGSCPGHFDIDPVTVKKIANADVFISQIWEKRFDNILDGINNKKLKRKYALTEGNWMIPDINIKASREIAEILSEISKNNRHKYENNRRKYVKSVQSEAKKVLKYLKKLKKFKVICAKHQEDFLKWMGLNVIASYERAEDLNIRSMAEVIKKAKEEKAVLVVDNLQSGANTGIQIAKDLGIAHVTLTNFPQNKSYIQTLQENSLKIKKSLKNQ